MRQATFSEGGGCYQKQLIDDLTLTYQPGSPVLKDVKDEAAIYYDYGFKPRNPNTAMQYSHDGNGNMTYDPHKVLFIGYNFLNLPQTINKFNGGIADITYDANGTKWRKVYTDQNGQTTQTDYVNGVVYQDGEVIAVHHHEGRVVPIYENGNIVDYEYQYWRRDHLGNTRVAFSDLDDNKLIAIRDNPNTPEDEIEVLQENHYYPFGMHFEGQWYSSPSPQQFPGDGDEDLCLENGAIPYQYNDKEFVSRLDLKWYDYGARWYDPAIAKFSTTDRFAEKYYPLSPYGYAANNPIKFIDVNGDSIKINFIGEYSQHAENQLAGIINNALEGQFQVSYSNVTYDKDNEIASGTLVVVPTEGGGDLEQMSLNGQEFYRELTEVAHSGGTAEIKADYARYDVHTGNFDQKTIDVADMLQFNKNLSDLGGTQAGKVIHEFREQYGKQVLGGNFSASHSAGIQSENNVNLSVRRDGNSNASSATQIFTGANGTVRTRINFRNRRVIKVENQ